MSLTITTCWNLLRSVPHHSLGTTITTSRAAFDIIHSETFCCLLNPTFLLLLMNRKEMKETLNLILHLFNSQRNTSGKIFHCVANFQQVSLPPLSQPEMFPTECYRNRAELTISSAKRARQKAQTTENYVDKLPSKIYEKTQYLSKYRHFLNTILTALQPLQAFVFCAIFVIELYPLIVCWFAEFSMSLYNNFLYTQPHAWCHPSISALYLYYQLLWWCAWSLL